MVTESVYLLDLQLANPACKQRHGNPEDLRWSRCKGKLLPIDGRPIVIGGQQVGDRALLHGHTAEDRASGLLDKFLRQVIVLEAEAEETLAEIAHDVEWVNIPIAFIIGDTDERDGTRAAEHGRHGASLGRGWFDLCTLAPASVDVPEVMAPEPSSGQAVVRRPAGVEEQKLRFTAFQRLPVQEADLAQDAIHTTVLAEAQFKARTLALRWSLPAREFDADGEGHTGGLAVPSRHVNGLAGPEKPDFDFLLWFGLGKKEAVR